MNVKHKPLKRGFIMAACLLTMSILAVREAMVCSVDYIIWMPRDKQADPLYRFESGGMTGYIDRSGKVVIEPKFSRRGNYGGEFRNGLMEIGVSDGEYVDTTGKLVINKGYYRGWDFSEGLAVAMRNDGEKWGYIDRTGEFVISPRFDSYPEGSVRSFSDGLAAIEVKNRVGYIDQSGEFTIQPTFLNGSDFKDGMARVVVEGPCHHLDDGICSFLPITLENEMPFCKYTFIDKSGVILTSQRYDRAKDFSEGLAPVQIGTQWGFIDKNGNIVINMQFDAAEPFSDGLALIRQNDLWGYINYAGIIVIPPKYKYAEPFSEELAVVGDWDDIRSAYDYYYINTQGEQAISERFTLASHFFKGLAHVKLKPDPGKNMSDAVANGSFAYIDATGRKIFVYAY